MAVEGSPTVRRRRLAAELRHIRLSRGESGDVVASALDWSPAKISRYELARTGLKPEEVEKLLDYYEVTGARRMRLLDLARDAAQKGWWEEAADVLAPDLVQLIGLEQEASSIELWQSDVVPGLLQTEHYARHIMSAYSRVEPTPPGVIERRVRIRMQRHDVVHRAYPPQLTFILDESVLLRRVGDDQLMREQLLHLADESDRENVTLRVLPLSGDHAFIGPSYVIFHFGPEAEATLHDVVSTEGLRQDFNVEGETDTYLHGLGFQLLLGESLGEDASRDLIIETARSQWPGT